MPPGANVATIPPSPLQSFVPEDGDVARSAAARKRPDAPPDPLAPAVGWFERRGWEAFGFQREVWEAYLAGESGLIHAATGTGKTYAAWLGPVLEWMRESAGGPDIRPAPPLRVLWITPLRALAADTEEALGLPLRDLRLPWTLESRT